MRLQERIGSKPGPRPVPLEPFGHQVAGQASMLTVDSNTVCKPLIPREHHLYRTLPPQLIPFTPRYKGVLYVRLEEVEDGSLNLWGYYPDSEDSQCPIEDDNEPSREILPSEDPQDYDQYLQPLQSDWSSGASTPLSSGSELDMPSAIETGQSPFPSRPSSGCVVRLKQDGEYEVKAGRTADNRFLITTDDKTDQKASEGSRSAEEPATQPLNPWGLSLHTRLLDKMRKSQSSASGCPFLVLENVVARFVRPCILDLKVGSRLHGDDASQKKIASQSRKCNITTSRSLGLRLCGMQVYQETTGTYKSVDKYHGRTLTDDTFCDILREFLHNGQKLRVDLLSPILARLNALLACLKELNSFRFYASSLLIMYDGLCPESKQKASDQQKFRSASAPVGKRNKELDESHSVQGIQACSRASDSITSDVSALKPSVCVDQGSSSETLVRASTQTSTSTMQDSRSSYGSTGSPVLMNGNSLSPFNTLVDVRMIDFAHTTHSGFQDAVVHEGPDRDYMWGLQNLTDMFLQIQKENS